MRPPRSLIALFVAALVAVAACGDNSLGLPTARFNNVVDTVSLWALDGTPLNTPSAYSISSREVVRTDQTPGFDFAFNITPAGQAVLLPTGALGLGKASGILLQSVPFDAISVVAASVYKNSTAADLAGSTVPVIRARR